MFCDYHTVLNTKLQAVMAAFAFALSEASVYFWLDMMDRRAAEAWEVKA
jgi:hypothetical protein